MTVPAEPLGSIAKSMTQKFESVAPNGMVRRR